MKRKAYRDAYVSAHISNTVASQIATLREARGWTQTDLAKKAGMKQPRISALEDPDCENFEVETIKRIASAFDVGLTVRFVPYSNIVNWAANLSDEALMVPDFDNDGVETFALNWVPADRYLTPTPAGLEAPSLMARWPTAPTKSANILVDYQ